MIGHLIFQLPDEEKRSFRLLERIKKKIINCQAAINFNIYIYIYIYNGSIYTNTKVTGGGDNQSQSRILPWMPCHLRSVLY